MVKGAYPRWETDYILSWSNKRRTCFKPHLALCSIGQPRSNYWIHHLIIALQNALELCRTQPKRENSEFADTQTSEYAESYAVDEIDRPIARLQDRTEEKVHYAHKHKQTTDKNILLVNLEDNWGEFLSKTEVRSRHDKRLADETKIVYSEGA